MECTCKIKCTSVTFLNVASLATRMCIAHPSTCFHSHREGAFSKCASHIPRCVFTRIAKVHSQMLVSVSLSLTKRVFTRIAKVHSLNACFSKTLSYLVSLFFFCLHALLLLLCTTSGQARRPRGPVASASLAALAAHGSRRPRGRLHKRTEYAVAHPTRPCSAAL